tara:strand:- start:428 stop:745 length:318 start_codon:yes stop_codon:yes gene_type:complete
MKLGIDELKKLIKEMLAEALPTTPTATALDPVDPETESSPEMEYTKYERENLNIQSETNKLLHELLVQMKTITYFTTPGRSPGESSLEKTMAGAIQEKQGEQENE